MQNQELKYPELCSLIEAGLRAGKSKGDMYRELGGTDDIAKLVAGTPDPVDRQTYQKLNRILVVVIIYFAIVKLIFSSIVFLQLAVPWYLFPLLLMVPAVAIWLAMQIRKFFGFYYLLVAFLGLAVVVKGFPTSSAELQQQNLVLWSIIYLPLLFGAGLGFYLKNRLFPHLGFLGAKTDRSGSYLFLTQPLAEQAATSEKHRDI